MSKCCICYTTDPGYFLPTLVSALQARRHSTSASADVIIFSIGEAGEAGRVMAKICEAEDIGFRHISSDSIEGADAMMARLYLDRMVPAEYFQLLYLDGDTQVIRSLEPLLGAQLPAGHFMAAKDPIAFAMASEEGGGKDGLYFESIGVHSAQQQRYFNSGVLRINRDGWAEIGREAHRLYMTMRERSRFPDQDALNIAGKERHIPMSLAWNFPIFLRNAGIENVVQPRVIHYMGRPKPWHGGFMPWGMEGYQPYLDVIRQYPELVPLAERVPAFRRVKYYGQQQYKRVSEGMTWRRGARKQAMLAYENALSVR